MEKTVRKNRALQNVKSEIEVLTLKTSRFENKYIKTDENMEKIIRERIDPHLQEELLIIWKKECLKEESKSKNMWLKKNKPFFENYEEKYGNDMFKKRNNMKNNRNNSPQQSMRKTYAQVAKISFNRSRSSSKPRRTSPRSNSRSTSRTPHIRPRSIPRNGQEWVNRRRNFNQKQINKNVGFVRQRQVGRRQNFGINKNRINRNTRNLNSRITKNNRIIMPNGDGWFTVQNNNRPSHFLAKDKLPPRWNR